MTPPLATVIIPAHNPRPAVLARTLDALNAQTIPRSSWEVLLIDNGSSPQLDERAWRQHLPGLNVIRENTLGLTHARLAGISAARGSVLVFVDDDNLLAPDYLEQALSFVSRHADVGVVGGRILGEFIVKPPAWAQPHLSRLALRDLGSSALISTHARDRSPKHYDYFAPFGAGMVVRAEVARSYQQWTAEASPLTDRTGAHLGGCGDCEIVVRALLDGYQCAYDPALSLAHLIPPERLRFSYLFRLAKDGQRSWGEFSVRHGFATHIPRLNSSLRQLHAFLTCKAWTRAGFISWTARCGYLSGRTTPAPRRREASTA